MKLTFVITARPSFSRVLTFIQAANLSENIEVEIVLAASAANKRYGDVEEMLRKEGLECKALLNTAVYSGAIDSMAKITASTILELSTYLLNNKPDAVVCIADRFETLSISLTASYMNIPVIHIQGGELTGNIDERVRHANSKLSDIHFVSTELSKNRLIRMGENPSSVHNTGCPSIDLVERMLKEDWDPNSIWENYGGVGERFDLKKGEYIVMLQHPETDLHDLSFDHITTTLEALKRFGKPVLVFWPNIDNGSDGISKGIRSFREENMHAPFHYFRNFHPEDFINLVNNSYSLVGNSSTGIRECSYLGKPVINIGGRQKNRERAANVQDAGYSTEEILNLLQKIQSIQVEKSTIYGSGNAGKEMVKVLESKSLGVKAAFYE